MRRAGGVVSFGCVVVGAAVVVGAVDVVLGSVVVDSAISVARVSGTVSSVVEDEEEEEEVTALAGAVSVTRSAKIADATRADAFGAGAVSSVSATGVGVAEESLDGENAAKPTTATSATISNPAYASGIRGLTMLRGLAVTSSRYGLRPDGWLRTLSSHVRVSAIAGNGNPLHGSFWKGECIDGRRRQRSIADTDCGFAWRTSMVRYLSLMRRFGTLLAVVMLMLIPAFAADAQSPDCAAVYPDASWTVVSPGGVLVAASGLEEGVAARFGREIAIVTDWLETEIGEVDVTICLIGETSSFDRGRYEVGSQQFHTISDLDSSVIAMNTEGQVGLVAPAMAFAMSQHALYQNNDREYFPQPIADTISHWYRGRIIERLPYYHHEQRGANLFETEAQLDWTSGAQESFRSWDPIRNESSIGAFVEYAVEHHGPGVLLTTDNATWQAIESDWRTDLRIELTGSAEESTGWIGGAVLVIAVIVIGVIMATIGIIRKRRRRPRPDSGDPIPGFFVDSGV